MSERRNPARDSRRGGVPELIKAAQLDTQEHTAYAVNTQDAHLPGRIILTHYLRPDEWPVSASKTLGVAA